MLVSQNTTLLHDIYKAQCKYSYSRTKNQPVPFIEFEEQFRLRQNSEIDILPKKLGGIIQTGESW